jgi:hypothetical protein
MTIEMGNPGIPGFGGYGAQNQPAPSTEGQAGNGAAASRATSQPDDHAEVAEEVASKTTHEQIPGLETSASDCLNRAAQIARSLNHANLSSDHLMLALTLDQSARRLLERVGDVVQLREAAMQKLGKNHTKFSRDIGEQPLPPTSDLDDLAKVARQAAAEREQSIAISDLINAFPKVDGRLTYSASETARTVAVIDTIEKGLVPRVDDALTRIEGAIVDAMQRQHQSVRTLLADLSSMQSQEWQRQQREFMDEIRRQVREAADVQVAAALKGLDEKFQDRVAERQIEQEPPAVVAAAEPDAGTAPSSVSTASGAAAPEKTSGSWSWLSIL